MSDKEVSQTVKDLAAKIKAELSIDSKTGHVDAKDGIWESTLPEGITKAQVKEVFEHAQNFTAGTYLAVGELAVDAMKKNSKLDTVDCEVKMHGHDKLHVSIERQRTFFNPANKDEQIVKHGAGKVNLQCMAGRSVGEMKKAMQYISSIAKEQLAK